MHDGGTSASASEDMEMVEVVGEELILRHLLRHQQVPADHAPTQHRNTTPNNTTDTTRATRRTRRQLAG
jgi:hypothetical protein